MSPVHSCVPYGEICRNIPSYREGGGGTEEAAENDAVETRGQDGEREEMAVAMERRGSNREEAVVV